MSTLTGREDLSHVRLVVLGGEEVHKEDLIDSKRSFPRILFLLTGWGLLNPQSPCSIFINHETEITGNIVPVGYPVEDTEVLLLNEAGQDAEVYGEIGIKAHMWH